MTSAYMADTRSTDTLNSRVDQVLAGWKKATAPVRTKAIEAALHTESQDISTQCHPNSRKDFQERLGTFSTLHWFAKPLELNLLTCARFGWINCGPDELMCKSCNQKLACSIDSRLGAEGAKKVAEGLNALLTDHHLDSCPWKHNPSPKSFILVHYWTEEAAFDAVLASVFKTCTQWNSSATSISIADSFLRKLRTELDLSSAEFTSCLHNVIAKAVSESSVKDLARDHNISTIVSLAVCGWDVVDGDKGVFACPYCNRSLKINIDVPSVEAVEPAAKRQKISDDTKAAICPLEEHRWFCPWQRVTDDEIEDPGWIQCAKAIKSIMLKEENAPTPSIKNEPTKPLIALAQVKGLLNFS